jgi:hypothetical protein
MSGPFVLAEKDGLQLGEHLTRVMAATPFDALQPPVDKSVGGEDRLGYPLEG